LLVCLGAKAQVKNQDMKELFLLLETDVSVEESRRRLLSNGFVSRGLIGSKQENLFGMIDSTSVILTLRKTNKKGKVWGYELLWNNAER
jgi:predicted transcriptional regulator